MSGESEKDWMYEEATNAQPSNRYVVRDVKDRTDPLYFGRAHDAMRVCSWLNIKAELEQALAHERGLRDIAEVGMRTANFNLEQERGLREAAEALAQVRADYPLRCQDCGGSHFLDTVIPSEIWNAIAGDVGVLCTLCIDKRLKAHGLTAMARFYYAGDALLSELYTEDLQGKLEAAEAERDFIAKENAGAAKGRLTWIWQQMHATEEQWAPLVNYSGGESMRTIESAFFQAFAKTSSLSEYASRLLAALTQQRQALEEMANSAELNTAGKWRLKVRAALATDHAALLAEGAALGVSQNAQEGA